jgi:2-oxoglutarate/2-oxoacid ferredoxin oxidoreductase subunit alpha
MAGRVLMMGNDAVGEGAIRAGCDAYFGYPITPQNEITAYMAAHMPEAGRVFIQAESELAAINMVFGAAVAGRRGMTSSSSPGISLKMEGISYLAGAELPAVIVNVQRGGPGLGNIAPSQADYFQATKGGGHGDYRLIVLAPDSVQEMHDHTRLAFELADRYRTPVMILSDGRLGQMMEPVDLYDGPAPVPPPKPWALTGAAGRAPSMIRSLLLEPGALEAHNLSLQRKYRDIARTEVRYEQRLTRDAEVLIVAYGTCARIAKGALVAARAAGLKAGLLRPITLWPFPAGRLRALAQQVKGILVVEMSAGQMIEDVQLAVAGRVPVAFEGRMGGGVPEESAVLKALARLAGPARRRTS